jgi:DNA (cytosine-5)-methyltransferase 1
MGYDARWGVLGAIDAGAPHKRERIWIVADNQSGGWGEGRERGFNPSDTRKSEQSLQELAHADSLRELQPQGGEQEQRGRAGYSGENVADADRGRLQQRDEGKRIVPKPDQSSEGKRRDWWESEPDVGRVAHGVAAILDIP